MVFNAPTEGSINDVKYTILILSFGEFVSETQLLIQLTIPDTINNVVNFILEY